MTVASLRFDAQGFDAHGLGAQGIPRRHAVAVGPKAFLALTIAATAVVGVAAGTSPKAGAGLTAALAAGLIVLRRPVLGGIVLAGVVPAVSGLRRGLPVPGLRLSEALIAGIAVILLATVARRQRAPWCAFDWVALGYVAVAALIGTYDLLRRGQGFDSTSLGTLAGPLEFFLLYRAAVVSLQAERSRRAALRAVLFASVPVSLLALLQRSGVLGVPGILRTLTGVDLSTDYSYAQLHRATGPFPHWQMLGAYLLVVILIAVALLLDRNQAVLRHRWLVGVLMLDAAALLETVSMSPLLAAIAGSVALSIWYGRGRQILVWLALAAAIGAVAFGSLLSARYDLQYARTPGQTTNAIVPNTLAYRYEVWTKQYLPALSGRWVTGWGPCCSTPTDLPSGLGWDFTESVYLTLLLRGGIMLLAVYGLLMWGFGALARRSSRAGAGPPGDRAVGRVLLVLVLALIPLQFVEPYFVDTGLPHLLWAMAGLLAAARAGHLHARRSHAGEAYARESYAGEAYREATA
jgi:hypothetical protein